MKTIVLVLISSLLSHTVAECEHGDDATCKDQIDSSALLQTKAYASEAEEHYVKQLGKNGEDLATADITEAECKGWCSTVPSGWPVKCKWDSCKGCEPCKPKGECKAWCAEVPSPWSAKCGWAGCKGCSSCSEAPPAPTPAPAPPPPPPPPPPAPEAPADDTGSGETGDSGTPGKVPETIPDRFLNCHNYWRCIHDSPPIKWDKDVAQGSQEWANRGQMSHSDCYHIPPPQGPTGENLASGSSMSPERACEMWHDESPENGPSCGGHCTAMLWKSAYKLGCGVKGGLVVCRYGGKSLRDGTPNFGGRSEYTQNVGYPDNSKEAECKKKWPLSTKGSTGGGGGRGGGGGNPFGGSGGGGDPFGGSGGGSSPFGGSGGSR
jgi:uncharacterized protein YkwD